MIPWSTLITGAVGLAGIAGAIVSAKIASKAAIQGVRINATADEQRDRERVKRTAYAQCQASFERMIRAIEDYRTSSLSKREDTLIGVQEVVASRVDMRVALSTLKLVGPENVRELADDVAKYLEDYVRQRNRDSSGPAADPQDGSRPLRHSLYNAMRADLGETSD
jgi:hypothetical protein